VALNQQQPKGFFKNIELFEGERKFTKGKIVEIIIEADTSANKIILPH